MLLSPACCCGANISQRATQALHCAHSTRFAVGKQTRSVRAKQSRMKRRRNRAIWPRLICGARRACAQHMARRRFQRQIAIRARCAAVGATGKRSGYKAAATANISRVPRFLHDRICDTPAAPPPAPESTPSEKNDAVYPFKSLATPFTGALFNPGVRTWAPKPGTGQKTFPNLIWGYR